MLMTLSKYKQNKYTCTEFSSVKLPTNKISSVNIFNNYKKHLSQTNKLFTTILNFCFLKLLLLLFLYVNYHLFQITLVCLK